MGSVFTIGDRGQPKLILRFKGLEERGHVNTKPGHGEFISPRKNVNDFYK